MKVSLHYKLSALHEAARFIWEKNQLVKQWYSQPQSVFDVQDQILEMMRRDAEKNARILVREKKEKINLEEEWISYSGTGGFYIIYELYDSSEEEISIGASILVDPTVGYSEPPFVTEELDTLAQTA